MTRSYDPKIRNPKVSSHRNGVAGASFHVVAFTWIDTDDGSQRIRNMVATVFESPYHTAVLDLDALTDGDIEARWRGDVFDSALRAAIAAYEQDRSAGTWDDDSVQFPRLIDECQAVLTEEQYEEMCASMDLGMDDLMTLFTRAQATWDAIKETL